MNQKRLALIIFLFGILINEWTLLPLSPDRAFLPRVIGLIRAYNIFCVLMALLVLNIDRFKVIYQASIFRNRFVKIFLFFIFYLLIAEMAARFCLFYFDRGLFFSSRLPGDAHFRVRFIADRGWGWRSHLTGLPLDRYHPLYGWENIPNARGILTGEDKTLQENKYANTNSKGLRGVREYSYVKPPGTLRIVVLGDSLAFGDEVNDDETFPYYLQELMPKAEVINMGVHSYGHDQMLLYFQGEGVKYQPDVVILCFVADDMYRNMLSFRSFAKPKFKIIHGELKLTNVPVPTPEQVVRTEFFRLKILDFLSPLFIKVKGMFVKEPSQQEMAALILDKLDSQVRTQGAKFMIFFLPTRYELSENQDPLVNKETYHQYYTKGLKGENFIVDYCRTRHLPYFSMRLFFEGLTPKDKWLAGRGHWDAKINRVIAEELRKFLVQALKDSK